MFQMNSLDYLFYTSKYRKHMIINTHTLVENKNLEDLSLNIIKNINKNIKNSIVHSCKVKRGFFKKEYPYLILEENIDLTNHVFSYNISNNFSKKEKELLVKSILDKDLNYKIPLWEVHIIHFYEKDNALIIRRVHHAVADAEVNAATTNIIFDNVTLPVIDIKNRKISFFNSVKSILPKLIKTGSLLAYGFLFKNKKSNDPDLAKSDPTFVIWDSVKNKEQSYSKEVFDYKSIETFIEKTQYSNTDVCVYIFSRTYSEYIKSLGLTTNEKLYISIPMSLNVKRKNLHGTWSKGLLVDLHVEEHNPLDRINKISASISEQNLLRKSSPLLSYFKAFLVYPFYGGIIKGIKLDRGVDWNNRRKIPKARKDRVLSSSSIGVRRISNNLSPYKNSLNGNAIFSHYATPVITPADGTIGFAAMFSLESEAFTITTTTVDGIIEQPLKLAKILSDVVASIPNILD
jgi:hypothetical protein